MRPAEGERTRVAVELGKEAGKKKKKQKKAELNVMSAPKEGFVFPGKDARLYVFRLRALRRGLEEKQLVRSKCDSRENKLEKTKGETLGVAEFADESLQTRKAGDVCVDSFSFTRMYNSRSLLRLVC